ncbi:TPR repeat-containing protein [Rhodopirellula maiorica SM1]|uniref:TPR repeat-containing protein n=1 Tax=Rhodopirellula maiorica SM1 TaxID=1265738 RepID=M5RL31_9BACT|nr:CRTAC1 family protein [Rhodopirellula maiorica]EMI20020.1 TPR repeat-containing protein [Rhodopirellula maiorica SM1]
MKILKIVLGLAVALVLIIAVVYFVRQSQDDAAPQSTSDQANARLQRTRNALAATENFESAAADEDWTALYEESPDDASIALNRALNRVLRVDVLTEKANNSLLDASEKQAARSELPQAIDAARNSIKDFAAAGDTPVIAVWLESRVDLHEASLLPATMTRTLRKEIFDRMVAAIDGDLGKRPESIILGGPLTQVLDELEDPIDGLPNDVAQKAAKALAILSSQNEDNLFIALRAAKLNLAIESADASDAVARTLRLARSIEPSLRRQTEPIGLTPDQLVAEILGSIQSAEWNAAENQMLLWFNVLNSTELVKTDRRRAAPHPLDRLSFDSLRRVAAEIAAQSPAIVDVAPLEFSSNVIFDSVEIAAVMPVDFDLDLIPDVVAASSTGKLALIKNDAGNWKPFASLELGMPVSGLLAADLFMVDSSDPSRIQVNRASGASETGNQVVSGARHNTLVTLVAFGNDGVQLIAVDGRADTADSDRLRMVDKATGLEEITTVTAAIAGDLEGDGDLDLMLATKNQGMRVFVNRGNRTFFEAAATDTATSLSKTSNIIAMEMVDLDRDLDLDVVTLDDAGQVGVVENLLHLQFRYRELAEIPKITAAHSISIDDVDGNVSWDVIVGSADATTIAYSQTAAAGIWTVDHVETTKQAGDAILVGDFNNDILPDVLRSSKSTASAFRLGTATESPVQSLDASLGETSLCIADFNADGLPDVLGIRDGRVLVSLNQTASEGHYLDVRFRGIDDNNASSGRVNHYAIGSVVELRFGPHYRAEVIRSPVTHFGLGEFEGPASLRVIFPNGLTQTIRDLKINTLVEEEQTLKGSCPYLYAWDGEKYAFVTDCLWAAPLGLQVADGVVAKDRPWEYLKIDGDHVRERDGKYELRITEELWEVAYFDHLSLVAVDHPETIDIWTNEKVGPAEIATPTIYAFDDQNVTKLKHAVDTQGRDISEKLSQIDQNYVQGFDRRLRQGLCEPHWIDVDFGSEFLPKPSAHRESIYLVLTGWILPTDTSLNIQIDQNPELQPIEFPSLWVPDAGEKDGWRKAIPFVGFPGGKTKTIVVDVTDAINREDPRLRIRTSAQIYWDAAQVAVQPKPATYQTHSLSLIDAKLDYRGFSKRIKESPQAPELYDYGQNSVAPKWPPLQGRFTQYGDCNELLAAWDDAMVVMGSGDEISLRFSVPTDAPPAGWKRDFVLHCVGWDKDADLNTLSGQSAGPLPFKQMKTYPPTRQQLDQIQRTDRLNAPHLHRVHDFRAFWSRP